VSGTVEFCGVDWRIGERVGLRPMMRYARVAKRQMQRAKSGGTSDGTDEIEALDATLSLLEQCVHPDDWEKFEQVTSAAGVDQEGYMDFAGRVMAQLADRPTGRSSDSSDGPRIIEPSSTDDSSSPVIHRLNDKGRPDLALMVRKRQESLAG
jgi:hypothetical protein